MSSVTEAHDKEKDEPVLAPQSEEPISVTDETLYCANHPQTETLLRCNRCGKPICLKCANQTAVGYRCNECIRNVQATYFNAESSDNPVAFLISMAVTAIAAPIAGMLIGRFGFFGIWIALLTGSGAGGLLAQFVRNAIGKRRSRNLRYFVIAGIISGLFLGAALTGLILGGGIGGVVVGLFSLFNLPMLLFTILAAVTAYQILR